MLACLITLTLTSAVQAQFASTPTNSRKPQQSFNRNRATFPPVVRRTIGQAPIGQTPIGQPNRGFNSGRNNRLPNRQLNRLPNQQLSAQQLRALKNQNVRNQLIRQQLQREFLLGGNAFQSGLQLNPVPSGAEFQGFGGRVGSANVINTNLNPVTQNVRSKRVQSKVRLERTQGPSPKVINNPFVKSK